MGGHQSVTGRGITCSDLCFRKITLVAVWRKDLREGKIPDRKGRRSF